MTFEQWASTCPSMTMSEKALARIVWAGARCSALEEAAVACEEMMAFNEDDPGTSAAVVIRKLKVSC